MFLFLCFVCESSDLFNYNYNLALAFNMCEGKFLTNVSGEERQNRKEREQMERDRYPWSQEGGLIYALEQMNIFA